ncbi:conserved hypothetical protein [Rubrivivax sp. A210]|uniref:type II secretion system protein N n=1 Tax=Rubrivivax sp. A210 TaxID=2772301 RepID=UPI001918B965|nr:type II secretion system protein N [Rubrivivax sp. A210]CAD5372573.1 conserved hypothetical protein [Rubrivivax sp. A210]
MTARWMSLVVWALAAASALFWGLRLFVKAPQAPAATQLAEPGAGQRGDLTRLLGIDPPPPQVADDGEPATDARFALIGVVSPRSPQAAREGLALIAVDGKPPRAYRIGAVVDGQNVLKTVSARGASLGPRDGAAAIALDLAPVAPAATGTLPAAPANGGAAPPPRQRALPQRLPVQQQPQNAVTNAAQAVAPVALPQDGGDPPHLSPQGSASMR